MSNIVKILTIYLIELLTNLIYVIHSKRKKKKIQIQTLQP